MSAAIIVLQFQYLHSDSRFLSSKAVVQCHYSMVGWPPLYREYLRIYVSKLLALFREIAGLPSWYAASVARGRRFEASVLHSHHSIHGRRFGKHNQAMEQAHIQLHFQWRFDSRSLELRIQRAICCDLKTRQPI